METKKLLFRYFLFCSLFITNTLYSQELQTVSRIGLGINGLDLAVELPIAKKITIEPSIGLGPSYDFGEGEALTFRMDWHWTLLNPSVHLGVNGKFIYNHKSEPKLFNSANFIGLKVKYVSKPLTDEIHYLTNTLLTNLNWGGQRNIGRHWIFSYSLGAGYGYNLDEPYGLFYPAFDLKFAYVLPYGRSN